MTSCNFYQAEKKDANNILNLLKEFKYDLLDCDYLLTGGVNKKQ